MPSAASLLGRPRGCPKNRRGSRRKDFCRPWDLFRKSVCVRRKFPWLGLGAVGGDSFVIGEGWRAFGVEQEQWTSGCSTGRRCIVGSLFFHQPKESALSPVVSDGHIHIHR